jgi:hypothetical protein
VDRRRAVRRGKHDPPAAKRRAGKRGGAVPEVEPLGGAAPFFAGQQRVRVDAPVRTCGLEARRNDHLLAPALEHDDEGCGGAEHVHDHGGGAAQRPGVPRQKGDVEVHAA